jgi:teichuronic acid biosynthesis glycosyltransferase TuaG
MPCHNASRYIGVAVRSVIAQTVTDWELVVIDDASTDDSIREVSQAAQGDPRIRCLRHTANCGAGIARNTGVRATSGRWIAFLDSDDEWLPNKLRRQVEYMTASDLALCCSGYAVEQGGGVVFRVDQGATLAKHDVLKNNVLCTSGVMIDRNRVPDLAFPDVRNGEDLLLWYRLLCEHGSTQLLSGVDVIHRRRRRSLSANKLSSALCVWSLYRDELHLPLSVRCYYFACYAWAGVRKHWFPELRIGRICRGTQP